MEISRSRKILIILVFWTIDPVTARATSERRLLAPLAASSQIGVKEVAPEIQCPLPGADKKRLSPEAGRRTIMSTRPVAAQETSITTNYVGPTPNLTAVANAIALRAKGLVTEIAFRSGITTSKPVAISLAYSSLVAQYQAPIQTYDSCQGNRFLYSDPVSSSAKGPTHAVRGEPRQMSIKVILSEHQPEGPPHVFTISLTATLDPSLEIRYDSRSTILETSIP